MSLPPLTLLEEFLLLALHDPVGQLYPLPPRALDVATAGAVLMDLALRERIDNDLTRLFVLDRIPIEDELLDPVLQTIALAPVLTPNPITYWLTFFSEEGEALRAKAFRRLESRGIVRHEDKKILWVFGTRRYPLIHDTERREVRMRILGCVLGNEIPSAHDVMLTGLAESCGLFRHILSAEEADAAHNRIAHIIRMDLIGQAVAGAIAQTLQGIAMASGCR